MAVHNSALIDACAEVGSGVNIGPYSVIGSGVKIGENTSIDSHVHIVGNTIIGRECSIYSGAVIGAVPQILGLSDIDSLVCIGDNTVIREYVTIHRSSKNGVATSVGADCFLMAYTHVAHDCSVGKGVIITNYTGLPGHVTVEDGAVISGYVGMHQFIRIGKLSMISGMSRLPKDVPPFSLVEGNPVRVLGINAVGLKRAGIPQNVRAALKRAFRILCRSGLNTSQALEKIKNELEPFDELNHLIKFVKHSKRGVSK